MTLARIGRGLAAPFVKLGGAYNAVAKRHPWSTGVWTTVLKTSTADMFAQKVVEGREEIDWRRNGVFTFFGFAYLGCFQFWLYNDLFVRMCAPITRMVGHVGAAPVKTFIDQCIHHPLFYFPAFYACKGAVEGRPLENSMEKYKSDLWENCKALWTVWVPAQLVNFAVVPLHLRLPFVAGVSFAWTVIISVMRGSLEQHVEQAGQIESPTMIQAVIHRVEEAVMDLPQDPAEVPAAVQHAYYHQDHPADQEPGSDAEGAGKAPQPASPAAVSPGIVHTLSAADFTAGAAAAVLGGRVPPPGVGVAMAMSSAE